MWCLLEVVRRLGLVLVAWVVIDRLIVLLTEIIFLSFLLVRCRIYKHEHRIRLVISETTKAEDNSVIESRHMA